jgi:hypothetical protein
MTLSITVLRAIMLDVAIFYCYAECRYAECRYAECHYAECRYAECHYAECRYAECHGAKCSSLKLCGNGPGAFDAKRFIMVSGKLVWFSPTSIIFSSKTET